MKKYDCFSKQELEEIFQSSYTFKEVSEKLGYINRRNKNIVIECAKKYKIPYDHLVIGKKQKWQNYSEQDIKNILISSISYKEALYKLGYTATDSKMNYKIDELASKYNINLNHFHKTGTLVGNTYGLLTVIEELEERCPSGKQYLCQCSCQAKTKVVVSASHLTSFHTQSCGCIQSKGELKISKILEQLGLPFEKEYTFKDLISDNNYPLRFDFYIPKLNILIEYQGKQHYVPADFFGGELGLKDLQKRDRQKLEYCKMHNLKLIIIPYTDFSKLNTSYLNERLES